MNAIAMDPHTVETTAAILVNNLINVLKDTKAPASQLEEALKPFAVIQWTREVINHVTVNKINRLFGRLKRSPVPKDTLRVVIEHFHTALAAEATVIPLKFTLWRESVQRASLTTLTGPDTWLEVWTAPEEHRIPDPASLAKISLLELQAITASSPFRDLIAPLRKAGRIENVHTMWLTPVTVALRKTVTTLPEALRAPSVDASAFGLEYDASKHLIGLPDDYEAMGPIARIEALQSLTPDSQQLLRFLSAGAQTNILQQVRLTLPQVASGVSCYLAFCSLLSIAPFPPTTGIVRQWSCMFATGKTFSIYVAHLMKACQLMQIDTVWRDDSIRAIAKGLANKPPTRTRFHNSFTKEWLDALIRAESWESQFAALAYIIPIYAPGAFRGTSALPRSTFRQTPVG